MRWPRPVTGAARVRRTLRTVELCQTLREWRHCRLESTQVLRVSTFGSWIRSRWPSAVNVAAQKLSAGLAVS